MFTSFSRFTKLTNLNNFNNTAKKYFGKNEKAIKLRIKSVSSIEKITKAMKMVFS